MVFGLKFAPKSRIGNTHTKTHLCGLTDTFFNIKIIKLANWSRHPAETTSAQVNVSLNELKLPCCIGLRTRLLDIRDEMCCDIAYSLSVPVLDSLKWRFHSWKNSSI